MRRAIRYGSRHGRESIWSQVNPPRVSELIAPGLMHLAGFRANSEAWEFSAAQPSSYRRPVNWRVITGQGDGVVGKWEAFDLAKNVRS